MGLSPSDHSGRVSAPPIAETHSRAESKLAYAMDYARYGIRVFPNHEIEADRQCSCGKLACSSAGKHPRLKDWQQLATTDEEQITRWWREWPNANIGVACGAESNLTVLDVDGDDGQATLRELKLQHSELPETPIAITGGKSGCHYYFQFVPGLQNAVRFAPGLDIRTQGGLVVGVGSVVTRRYLWEEAFRLSDELQPAKMPPWLADMVRAASVGKFDGPGFEVPVKIPAGGRNDILYRLARSLKARGLSLAAAMAALQAENLAKCEPPLPDAEVVELVRHAFEQADQSSFKSGDEQPHSASGSDYREQHPRPLPDGAPAVPSFDPKLLPESLRGWIEDIANRAQAPLDFPAIGAITALASVVGRRIRMHPKRHDDWTVIPNLWGLIVGSPGMLKSPMLKEVMRPLKQLEDEAETSNRLAMEEYQLQEEAIAAERRRVLTRAAAPKSAISRDEVVTALRKLRVEPPASRRYIVNDTTVEKLGIILNQNPQGLLLFRDEIIGFLANMDRLGHENDRAFYLEAWAGTGGYTYDRVNRGTLRIEAVCVSILGAIHQDH